MKDTLTRIGVFYDGNFFNVVSNYYAYHHTRKARISVTGLHEFVRQRVAHEEQVDQRRCQVVDVHYFRGRFSADEANDAGKLLDERRFDDILIREGVTTHYLPMSYSGKEKGIDVWFALEAYELAIHKRFDVCVLIAGDSDYIPLARKLNTLGARVMVLGWDFEYSDHRDRVRTTKTSQGLLNEVTYPVLVSALIEDKTQKEMVKALFLPQRERATAIDGINALHSTESSAAQRQRRRGRVSNLIEREAENKRFGYIIPDDGGDSLWFAEWDLDGVAFGALSRGDSVTYALGTNWIGPCAREVRWADA